ncbi:MAG TPA: TadE/TadG family type IV pilus assembly protein [Methylomirabilota bacterium]|jgi:Flp pilus assembly protein TadG
MRGVVKSERGTSSIEFLLIAPFLLFILFASVELSRAWFTMNLMTTAAREAVRAGVVAAPTNVTAAGNARLTQILAASPSTAGWTGGVTCSANPCAPDAVVTATVSLNFTTVVPNLLPMLNPIVLQQTASMRYE